MIPQSIKYKMDHVHYATLPPPEGSPLGHWIGEPQAEYRYINGCDNLNYFVRPNRLPRVFQFFDGSMMTDKFEIICGACGCYGHHNFDANICFVSEIIES